MSFRKNLFVLVALTLTAAPAQSQEKPLAPYSTAACVAKELGLQAEADDILLSGRRRIHISGFGQGPQAEVYFEKFIFIGSRGQLSYHERTLSLSGDKKSVVKNTLMAGQYAAKINHPWYVSLNNRTLDPSPQNLTEAFEAFNATAKCLKEIEVEARNPEPPRVIEPIGHLDELAI